MEIIIVLVVIVVLFFIFTPSPSSSTIIHDDIHNRSDEFLQSEIERLGRWFTHHNDGPQSFREKASNSGVTTKYSEYGNAIRLEKSRRGFIRSILESIPEINTGGESSYISALKDGIFKIAWDMKNSGKTDVEIISWIRSEIGSSEQPKQPEPQMTLRNLVEAVVAVGKTQEVRTLLKSILKDKAEGISEEALITTAAHTFIGVSLKLIQTKYGMGVYFNALPLFEEQYLSEYAKYFSEMDESMFSVPALIPNETERSFIRAKFHFLKENELPNEMLPAAFSAICSYRINSYYTNMDLSGKGPESPPFYKAAHLVMLQLYGEQKAKELKAEEILLSNELARIDQLLDAAIKVNPSV